MLQYIARIVRDIFGEEVTYRIGGDEFVAFVIDSEEMALKDKPEDLQQSVEREGYHVAVGCNRMKKEKIEMEALIKAAEIAMYKNKSEYYKNRNVECRPRG